VFNIKDNQVPHPIESVNGKTQIRLSDVQFLEDDVRKKLMKLRENQAPGADDIAPSLLCITIHHS